jgi:hypothetical protein
LRYFAWTELLDQKIHGYVAVIMPEVAREHDL